MTAEKSQTDGQKSAGFSHDQRCHSEYGAAEDGLARNRPRTTRQNRAIKACSRLVIKGAQIGRLVGVISLV